MVYRRINYQCSANRITDFTVAPIQYIHYAPFGELLLNENEYGYDERYKFTGKERDAETGYNYFGARYYSYALGGHWLSVDPMSDKYPHITPYAYCNWNPVKFVDPDGRLVIIVDNNETTLYDPKNIYDGDNTYIRSVCDQLNQLRIDNPDVAKIIDEIANNEFYNTISKDDLGIGNYCKTSMEQGTPQNAQIGYDPNNNTTINGDIRSPRIGLAHELQHAIEANRGTMDNTEVVPGIPQKEINAINTEIKYEKP